MTSAHLLPGQMLSREEFLRRWDALPELKNAELIDGIVYMASPVSMDRGARDGAVHLVLSYYAAATPGCRFGCNQTWLMRGSAPQPDADLRILPEFGGQSRVHAGYGLGAPELAAEVTGSRASHDLGPKLALYQRSGVLEYLAVILDPPQVLLRTLVNGAYAAVEPDAGGVLRSRVFPGLWIDAAALLADDTARLLAVLQQGIASEEHAAFVTALAARKTGA